MDQLWSPWRMAYIRREQPEEGAECFLCANPLRNEDDRTFILGRGEHCFIVLNLYPYNPGHLMIAPYAHVATIEEMETPVLTEMMTLAQRCLKACHAAMNPDGFNMGINQGRGAGAGIADHVHYHIVPRWNGDTNFMPVLAEVKVIPDLLENTYRDLRAVLQPLMAQS
jgi:ATP adenylyltransferase